MYVVQVLRIANHIVPGHGPIFEVTEEIRSLHDAHVRKMRSHRWSTAEPTGENSSGDFNNHDEQISNGNVKLQHGGEDVC